jgi:hypothetical protein
LVRASPFLRANDRIASLGSCFAANMVPRLRRSGYFYIDEEPRHPAFAGLPPDNFSYEKFSAAYGNIYTPRQFLQLLDRAEGLFHPREDRWVVGSEIIDPFRPGLKYPARTHREFDALTRSHLAAARRAFSKASVVIFTLGLTEAWVSSADGAVFPACPGTVAGEFDPAKHVFHNFTFAEIVADLEAILSRLRAYREDIRLLLTVSPVPLVATASDDHVVEATVYSKSLLRAACGDIVARHANVGYFPAYEIVAGPQAPKDYFDADKRNVSMKGVNSVMRVFLASCEPVNPASATPAPDISKAMSKSVVDAECEEAASQL